jgi:hypothetical protein
MNYRCFVAVVFILVLSAITVQAAVSFENDFNSPPASAKPWVYWYWFNGNISAEGIRADLAAMQDVGIGGVMLFDIGVYHPQGPIKNRSKEWYELVKLAISEAASRNIKVTIGCPGWSASGGPWITPELGMQEIVWNQTDICGPQQFSAIIPQPSNRLGSYHDIALLAFPMIANDIPLKELKPVFRKTTGEILSGVENIIDGNSNTFATLASQFEIIFEKPVEVRHMYVQLNQYPWTWTGKLEAFDSDSNSFVLVADRQRFYSVGIGCSNSAGSVFNVVRSARFRFTITDQELCRGLDSTVIYEFDLRGSYRIENWLGKAAFHKGPPPSVISENMPGRNDIIPLDKIVDLTSKMSPNGELTWDVPTGKWTVLRIGYTPRGALNNPAPWGGRGLECDKLSRQAVDFHYDQCVKPILKELGPDIVRKAMAYYHVDSFETGWQNWTHEFVSEFKARRGYDIIKYLPAITGRVVTDCNTTDRFLWDFRRTIGDLFAENHAARLAQRTCEDGLEFSNEPYGSIFENLQHGGHADLPMVEFWQPADVFSSRPNSGCLESISIAHTYGRQIVAAEAFTSAMPNGRWNEYPFQLKPTGDYYYCNGVNRFVLHVYSHQPWTNEHLRPGFTCGPFGTHYDRFNTWWNQSKPWIQYLTRCQYMLQQGKSVAQVLYYQGADVPSGIDYLEPKLPEGFSLDAVNKEIILTASVQNGSIVLPSGACYKYLVLPPHRLINVDALSKVEELVQNGVTVIGPRPQASPSLAEYPAASEKINKIAASLWDTTDNGTKNVGKGRVIWGMDFTTILENDKQTADFNYDAGAGMKLHFTHRQTPTEDIYFVANVSQKAGWAMCTFHRVSGRVPQLWHPDSGLIEECAVFEPNGDTVRIPIRFDRAGSVFVVFRSESSNVNQVTTVTRDGRNALEKSGSEEANDLPPDIELSRNSESALQARVWKAGKYELKLQDGQSRTFEVASLPQPLAVAGPWKVMFPAGWGTPNEIELSKLISWTEHPDSGVKYFSGTAVYHTMTAILPENIGQGKSVHLDLGEVDVFAEVKVNEHDFGILWKPPFRLDITSAAKSGENKIEVRVTNLWANRLIGDEQYPLDAQYNDSNIITKWPEWLADPSKRPEPRRQTFTSFRAWKKDEPLLPSGLIGPVQILTAEEMRVR